MTDVMKRWDADMKEEYKQENETLHQRVKDLEDYLREVAVEAGLPPETLDIATCRHIAHQVKSIRNASVQFMEELAALNQAQGTPVAMVVGLGRERYGLRWAGKDGEAYYKSKAANHDVKPLYTSAPTIPAIAECRDAILNGRGALESVLDGDQTNAVLAVFDDYLASAPKYTKEMK